MNIYDLTLGKIKQIQSLIGKNESTKQDDFVGKYVICRFYSAGVHAGEFVSQNGDVVELKNSRRLWSWKAKEGIALSGVAQYGITSGCKIDVVNPIIRLNGWVETIPASKIAQDSINEYK